MCKKHMITIHQETNLIYMHEKISTVIELQACNTK